MFQMIKRPFKTVGFALYIFFAAIFLISPHGVLAGSQTGEEVLKNLKARLVKDGFNKKQMDALYASEGVAFDFEGISLFFVHRESTLNYGRFLEEHSISKARKYLETHRTDLQKVEKRFGVDKTVITAIILVETGLGSYLGNRSVLNTFSTLAVLSDGEAREYVWDSLPKNGRLSRERFDKKADRRAKWAYEELKALIRYTAREDLPAHQIKGSYAGAMGIPQFMPSRILQLAKDGNRDGRVDLFTHKDAIASVANYLKHFGWHPGIERKKARRVIMRYNYSTYYADTVLKISETLKG